MKLLTDVTVLLDPKSVTESAGDALVRAMLADRIRREQGL